MARRNYHKPLVEGPSMFDHFEGAKADYQAAKPSRFKRVRYGNLPYGSSGDWHTRNDIDFYTVMEQARDMDRNDVIVSQLVTRATDNTLQDGLTVDPQTGDDGADRELAARWKAWSEDPDQCDVRGEQSFGELEHLALRQTHIDGDTLALLLREGSIQMVEAHRCRRPLKTQRNVIHGILLDELRRPLEYWLTKEEVGPMQAVNLVGDIKAYPARDADGERIVCHVHNPKRITQTRGLSALAPIMDSLGMFEDIQFARLVQQQVLSCFTIFRERSAEFKGGPTPAAGEQSEDPLSDGSTRVVEGVAPGMQITGQVGETLKGFTPNVPADGYFEHVRLILTLCSINLGMPLVMALLDASETNFSGWRGAVDQARLGFRRNQSWLTERFHIPIYRWKVRQWRSEDAGLRAASERAGVDLLRHVWNRPAWPYIDPLKDASADLLRQRNALISPRRLQAERGRDWPGLVTEIVADNALAIRAAKTEAEAINTEFPSDDPVHWRELISLPTPDGVEVTVSATGGAGVAEDAPAPPAKTPAK